jgi:hypothetical protein
MAFASLRMGDAEIVKHLYWNSLKLPEDLPKTLAAQASVWEEGDSKLASAVVPRLFVRTGDFTWRRGAVLAATLHARGGREALDRAYDAPPRSTEQVLHPEKYLSAERPVEIHTGPADEFLAGRGYKRAYRTVLGELGAALVLETHFPKEDLAAASAGWGGDALSVYEKEGRLSLVLWATEWDTPEDASQFEEQAKRLTAKLVPEGSAVSAPVARKKTSVVLAVNVAADIREGLLEAVWKSRRTRDKADTYGD